MKTFRHIGQALSVTSLLFFAEAQPASAKNVCSLRSITGSYGYTVNGTNLSSGPLAAVGLVSSDGTGNLTASETDSLNGTIVRRTITGTYTVNPDCTGTVTFTDNFNQTTHLDFVAVQDQAELRFIQTDSGSVTTGVATKQ
jgi:hypothetical protein